MPRRTRSFLLDNTVGRVFSNVTETVTAAADKIIAGTRPQTKSIAQKSTQTVSVTKNLGGISRGLQLATGDALITKIDMKVASAATGSQGLVIALRKGYDYTSSTQIATYTLSQGVRDTTKDVSITIAAGEAVFVDIVQPGSIVPAKGLSVIFTFFA